MFYKILIIKVWNKSGYSPDSILTFKRLYTNILLLFEVSYFEQSPSWLQTIFPHCKQLLTRSCLAAWHSQMWRPFSITIFFKAWPSDEYSATNFVFFLDPETSSPPWLGFGGEFSLFICNLFQIQELKIYFNKCWETFLDSHSKTLVTDLKFEMQVLLE